MVTTEEVKKDIVEILRLPIQPEDIADEMPLINDKSFMLMNVKTLEIDSIDIIELVTGLESKHKIRIPDEDIRSNSLDNSPFGDIVKLTKYINEKINGNS